MRENANSRIDAHKYVWSRDPRWQSAKLNAQPDCQALITDVGASSRRRQATNPATGGPSAKISCPVISAHSLTISLDLIGCFLDGFSMIVMTLPIVLPIVKAAGFDAIWFGIFLVLVVEMAQITPPVGFNLFVIQGLTEDSLGYIARVTMPYLIIMVLFTLLLAVFPEIVMFLPNRV